MEHKEFDGQRLVSDFLAGVDKRRIKGSHALATLGSATRLGGEVATASSSMHINDIDGVGNASGEAIAEKHFLNAEGVWMPIKEQEQYEAPYDEQPRLIARAIEGVPWYVQTMDGRTFSGRAEPDGQLPRIDTYGEDEYVVYWGDEALMKMEGAQT